MKMILSAPLMGKGQKKGLFIASTFVLLGIIFLILENSFYQYVSEDGYLHESLFMPLGFISIFIGILMIIANFLMLLYKRFR